ncbi:class IV adenylate cyclase [Candidatus Woesearchaeota archaeon]|nr:class IV adenylate cyclase [Candidatus Woesearchaeota archaeon]
MKEIEFKILEINPNEIRKKLKKAGAKKVFAGNILAQYYDCENLMVRSRGNLLRLRMFGKEPQLTIKKILGRKGYKVAEETDIVVGDFKRMHDALLALGFGCYGCLKKKRERWHLGGINFEIDKYPNIPYYVEIEAKTEKSSADAKKKLQKAVRLLGYKMSDAKPMNAFEVHKHYGINIARG